MHPAYQSAFKLMDLTANFNEQGPLPKLPPFKFNVQGSVFEGLTFLGLESASNRIHPPPTPIDRY